VGHRSLAVRVAVSTVPVDLGRDHHRQARDRDPLTPAGIPCVWRWKSRRAVGGLVARAVTELLMLGIEVAESTVGEWRTLDCTVRGAPPPTFSPPTSICRVLRPEFAVILIEPQKARSVSEPIGRAGQFRHGLVHVLTENEFSRALAIERNFRRHRSLYAWS
jgi:hypothetical protein